MQNKCKLFLFFAVFSFVSFSCSLSETQTADVMKILEIRAAKLNAGDINSVDLLLADSFPDRKNYLSQLNLQQQYFLRYAYTMNSTKINDVADLGKSAMIEVDYDLQYRGPEDVAETFWIGRKETVLMVKDKIGWKIADIKFVEGSGRKIDPQTVHDIFFALDTRKTALNNGDVELFKSVIDNFYSSRNELVENFKKNATAFIDVNYNLTGREFQYISPALDEARVVQYYNLIFKVKGLDTAENIEDQREIISLKKSSSGTWTITDGLK